MTVLDFPTLAQIVAGRALNTVLEGVALSALAWTALRCFGTRSSMMRFAVWFSTLLTIVVLPLMSGIVSPVFAPASPLHGLTLSSEWAVSLLSAWALISAVLLVRLAMSLRHVQQLRNNCRQVDAQAYPGLIEIAGQFARDNQRTRPVQLLSSDDLRIPTALGFFRPAVVLPEWTLRDLSPDELRLIVLHELAHLRRWDDWTNLAQKFVKALFFFHPAVWWIDSRLALEREIACDDMVLEQTANAHTYAASLVSLAEKVVAEKLRVGRALALAQSAVGRVREISQRVARILATDRPRADRGLRPALAMIGTLTVMTVGAMPYVPHIISFQSKAQPTFSAASEDARPIEVVPVVLKRPVHRSSERPVSTMGSASLRASTSLSPVAKSRRAPDAIVRAEAAPRKSGRATSVVMARASDRPMRNARLLVWHSSQVDELNEPVWTLTVWRVTTADGRQQTLQETIVMNSL